MNEDKAIAMLLEVDGGCSFCVAKVIAGLEVLAPDVVPKLWAAIDADDHDGFRPSREYVEENIPLYRSADT